MIIRKNLSVEEISNACAVRVAKLEKLSVGQYFGRVEFFGKLDEHGVWQLESASVTVSTERSS